MLKFVNIPLRTPKKALADIRKNNFKEIHEDEEDTARIGRSGDPSKIENI